MHEVFEHTADLGIRARAATLSEVFAEAARALASVIVEEIDRVESSGEKRIEIEAEPVEFLLHDWLTEILYTFEVENLLLCQFEVEVSTHGLKAVCHGERLDRRHHRLAHEVKAVTYHGLTVRREADGWLAEAILDI